MGLDSVFLEVYLKENLITLLVALLAINTTTSSVVMTKLKEIADATNASFKPTIEQLKLSILEQVVFIIIAVLLLIFSGSKTIIEFHEWIPFILNGFIASIFILGLHALHDTATAIFVILQYEDLDG